MALIVQKYGGTSVGSLERIAAVADRVVATRRQGHDVVVVVSAMAGETNRLIALAHAVSPRPDPREMDVLLATGEQTTIALLAMALKARGQPALSLTGDQVRIDTDHRHGKARISHIDNAIIDQALARGQVVVVAGFQGRGPDNAITTLGRGGSDTTAVALAAALKAAECQIFTDVDGIYTTDPRIDSRARKLDSIDFHAMLALSAQGAKVLQVRSVEVAGQYQVPLRVLSSFGDGQGTLVTYAPTQDAMEVSGVACCGQSALIQIHDARLQASQLLLPLEDAGIDVDVLEDSQDCSGTLCFTVPQADLHQVQDIITAALKGLTQAQLQVDESIAKVSVVGCHLDSNQQLTAEVTALLSAAGIGIGLMRHAPQRLSLLVARQDMEKSVRLLHGALVPTAA